MTSVTPEDQQPQMRVVRVTGTDDPTPLAEVLVMLYDWSVERRLASEKSGEA